VWPGGTVTIRSEGSASLAGRRHRATDLIQPRDPLFCPPYLNASPKEQTLCLSGVVIKQQHYSKKWFFDPIMYRHDILFKIISIGSCTPFCKKNLSGLETFSDVISQGRHLQLLCRLSIHLTQQIEGFGGSFLHFHIKLMFTRCSVFVIKLHRDKFKGTEYERNIYNTQHYVNKTERG